METICLVYMYKDSKYSDSFDWNWKTTQTNPTFAYTLNVFTSAPWRLYQNITQYPRDAGNSGETNLVVEVVEDECRLAWL